MASKPVAIIMGSQSDWTTMKHAAKTLDALRIGYDARIVSAHRTPKRLYEFASGARKAGFKVIIAGAGGAAHLPGMAASMTPLPVLGVPVNTHALEGKDYEKFLKALEDAKEKGVMGTELPEVEDQIEDDGIDDELDEDEPEEIAAAGEPPPSGTNSH